MVQASREQNKKLSEDLELNRTQLASVKAELEEVKNVHQGNTW
jgi:hypothetical protein